MGFINLKFNGLINSKFIDYMRLNLTAFVKLKYNDGFYNFEV